MTSRPAISVVMAVWNGERYVRLAIDSVLAQDFTDFELIVVDDASIDRTPEIVASYGDPRIVYIRSERNMGQTPSLNVGLRRARADLIARIDADDIYLPGKLRRQYEIMNARPDVAVCGTGAIKIDPDGRQFGRYVPPTRPADVKFLLCQRVPVCHVSVMMRRDAVLEAGGYDERYKYAADFALWSKLAARGATITSVPDPLTLYREFPQSLGHVHKLGAAGDESAEIIRQNFAALAGRELTSDESRAVALLYFPSAGLGYPELARAYLHVAAAARAVYGRVPVRVRVELSSVLAWSFVKLAELQRRSPDGRGQSLWATARQFRRHPLIPAVCLVAAAGAGLGEARLYRIKETLMRVLIQRFR
jgi:glycosyltransferase involved in cell wall biosynthesis